MILVDSTEKIEYSQQYREKGNITRDPGKKLWFACIIIARYSLHIIVMVLIRVKKLYMDVNSCYMKKLLLYKY